MKIDAGFDRGDREQMQASVADQEVRVGAAWFRGSAARYRPRKANVVSPEHVKSAILDGWLPPRPVIDKRTRILTFGSCFAGNIARHLTAAGFNLVGEKSRSAMGEQSKSVYLVVCNEAIVNTFTIRQLFQWIYENKIPNEPTWRDEGSSLYRFTEEKRKQTAAIVDESEVLIITLGLSEIWYNKQNGDVYSSSIPRDLFDDSKHGFRVSTVDENRENLDVVYRLIRKHKPNARIVITLSPVPLLATFRPISCISANTVSKAILRVALDEFLRAHASDERLHYWPSYEIVMDGFQDSFLEDNRHVRPEILAYIMTLFESIYCSNGVNKAVLAENYATACSASMGGGNVLPPKLRNSGLSTL
jgi:hypothetical protein